MSWLIVALIGYGIGCLHGSHLVGSFKRINLKETGVKNAGASNATIVLGWKYGLIVAFIDVFKGTISLIIVHLLVGSTVSISILLALLYVNALFVIIGHNFPMQMRFRGGKGTASLAGVTLAIDWRIALISIGLLFVITYFSDYLIIGVSVMYASFTATTILFDMGWIPVVITIILWSISSWKHIENFQRLRNGNETTLSSLLHKKKAV
ncbi:glycerol-3-phosphate acyltransferase [Jeotgalibacillus soli]|uniref:Glycerol-3-phosphate acyltransferase n=1 Tax=Jeotgalibacillus soli TaxID=889306 RepID=A0A0C2RQV0_9BACL|nr:glycerol-3-phosphate acyltransferase [Jeotgalibacillus soli]KIL44114.1 glycerol-3-phosphate acyltransferase [Jeotgalibacillus soli]